MYVSRLVSALILGSALSTSVFAAPMHSSIQVPYQKTAESKEEVNTARLKQMAKLSYADAVAIARKRFNGKLGQVDLENEDGNLIYSVEIGKRELAIDAGTGKILLVE